VPFHRQHRTGSFDDDSMLLHGVQESFDEDDDTDDYSMSDVVTKPDNNDTNSSGNGNYFNMSSPPSVIPSSPASSTSSSVPMGVLVTSLTEDEQGMFVRVDKDEIDETETVQPQQHIRIVSDSDISRPQHRRRKSVSFTTKCDEVYDYHHLPSQDDIMTDNDSSSYDISETTMTPSDFQQIEEEVLPILAHMNSMVAAGLMSIQPPTTSFSTSSLSQSPCTTTATSSSTSTTTTSSSFRGLECYNQQGQILSRERRKRLYGVVHQFQDFVKTVQQLDAIVSSTSTLPGDLLAEFLADTGISVQSSVEAHSRAMQDWYDIIDHDNITHDTNSWE
jgi:hypothetical protein